MRLKAFNNGTGDWPMWKRMDLGRLNAFAEQYLFNYNDDRLFGRSDPTKPDPNFPGVGKNFSRLL